MHTAIYHLQSNNHARGGGLEHSISREHILYQKNTFSLSHLKSNHLQSNKHTSGGCLKSCRAGIGQMVGPVGSGRVLGQFPHMSPRIYYPASYTISARTHRPDGERYSGDWFEGERSGHGVWTGPTGDDYQGEYQRDKRNGVGVYMFASGASGSSSEGGGGEKMTPLVEGDFGDTSGHGILAGIVIISGKSIFSNY
jgi:hypothetical protein